MTRGQIAQKLGDTADELVGAMHSTGILYTEAVREFKKRFIEKVLKANGGNCCHAARELRMHRNSLSRTMAELGIDPNDFRATCRRKPMRRFNDGFGTKGMAARA